MSQQTIRQPVRGEGGSLLAGHSHTTGIDCHTNQGPAVGVIGSLGLISRAQLSDYPHWKGAFSDKRKDGRYYELVEDTIRKGFNYGYFVIKGDHDKVDAIQPFFIIDQDLVAGVSPTIGAWINAIRGVWPRFLKMRTLMVGCAAGEGHLTATNRR
jgi:hypothetical protein